MIARVIEVNDWDVVRLSTDVLEVDVLPGKGGDILQIRFDGTPLLFESPWGLRARRAAAPEGDSAERWLALYPGGWQTIFPNGGQESGGYGFHGDASLVAYDYSLSEDAVHMRARLKSSPFEIVRTVRVRDEEVEVRERITNIGDDLLSAMWSQHPAFGSPLVSDACIVEVAARTFEADDARDMPAGDLRPGARSAWPHGIG
ncbi:MAG TPA: DUF4432 family protein, partial [Actinomycetota bacterium]|nr:DUF4432 family protein [Actinomycetota bacterium]